MDNVSVGPVTSYTFTDVQANHTIDASFMAAPTLTITSAAGPGGAISPSGAVSVACGADTTFTITPDSCHVIADVLVDNVSVGPVTSYTFTAVQANHTIDASFSPIAYTITVANSGNGAALGVGVSDPLVGTLACTIGGSPASLPVPSLAAGASLVCTATYTLTSATPP